MSCNSYILCFQISLFEFPWKKWNIPKIFRYKNFEIANKAEKWRWSEFRRPDSHTCARFQIKIGEIGGRQIRGNKQFPDPTRVQILINPTWGFCVFGPWPDPSQRVAQRNLFEWLRTLFPNVNNVFLIRHRDVIAIWMLLERHRVQLALCRFWGWVKILYLQLLYQM